MKMLQHFKKILIDSLWNTFYHDNHSAHKLSDFLKKHHVEKIPLDHFAVIDLPSAHSGIPTLNKIFTLLDFVDRGSGYLSEKQNDFRWLADKNALSEKAEEALPQIVIADFRLQNMPASVSEIIQRYASKVPPVSFAKIHALLHLITHNNETAFHELLSLLLHYFSGRDWPLPTIKEYETVKAYNELLAWVLVFGRRPNHFTLSIHLLKNFISLEGFHKQVMQDTKLTFNTEGGLIKGCAAVGIAQSATLGLSETIVLADGEVTIRSSFIEFAYRYPTCKNPSYWNDYFTGFVSNNANHIIESLSQ